ncbi:MAG TPA: arginine--tRNA ligase [Planctomycetota bacterium]|nr:arginine--tRNA ligase [Planctomycetota bacterium]
MSKAASAFTGSSECNPHTALWNLRPPRVIVASMKIAAHSAYTAIVSALSIATGLEREAVAAQISRPPNAAMGDYAFPCFVYAKQNKLAPNAACEKLAALLRVDKSLEKIVGKIDCAGAFLNLYVFPGVLCKSILDLVHDPLGENAPFGTSKAGAGKTIVIDYSGPNIAKPFHVGHLMSTIIGASLARIFRALGYSVVGVNHLGDWGVQCGFQFLAWQRADPVEREKQLRERGLDYLCDLYVEINSAAKQVAVLEAELNAAPCQLDPDKRAELCKRIDAAKQEADARDVQARALFKKLEDGDTELKKLWEMFRTVTLEVLQKSYDRLGVKFESNAGEGFYEPMLKPLLAELKEKGIAIESQGALVIPMDDAPPKPGKDPKPPFILRKSDEATIYGTRDLAAALYRKTTYDFFKNLYVVDLRQSGHFQMLFKAVAKMGHAWAKDCVHVSFGLMQIREGETVMAMTTRGGQMIPLSELLDKMVAVVRKIVSEKNPELIEQKAAAVSEAVGVGAIIYWVQARRRASSFVFDWAKATDPSGDTGPYLQYTHARACSILRKWRAANGPGLAVGPADLSLLIESEETAVCKILEGYPNAVEQAALDYEPSLVATYLLELSSAFGNFLNKHRVLDSAPELRHARIVLVDAVRVVLARGLALLGVAAPEEM